LDARTTWPSTVLIIAAARKVGELRLPMSLIEKVQIKYALPISETPCEAVAPSTETRRIPGWPTCESRVDYRTSAAAHKDGKRAAPGSALPDALGQLRESRLAPTSSAWHACQHG